MPRPTDPKDPIHPGTTTFPELDVARLASRLQLEARGRQNCTVDGVSNARHAVIEHEVASTLEAMVRKERQEYEAGLQVTEARIMAAGFDDASRVMIEAHAATGIADFRAKISKQRVRLEVATRGVENVERQYRSFVKRHKLEDVSAIVPTTSERTWTVIFVLVVLLAESTLNAGFFAKGSTTGLLGGLLMAGALSILNVSIAVALGAFSLRYMRDVRWPARLAGCVSSLLLLVAMIGANLLIAHYRDAFAEAKGGEVDFARVLTEVASTPFALREGESWLLGVVGVILCFAATWKIYSVGDPYPGFGSIAGRYDRAIADLQHERTDCINDLQETHENTIKDMEVEIKTVTEKAQEHALAARSRVRRRAEFIEYLRQVSRAHQALLDVYYSAAGVDRQSPDLTFQPPDPLPPAPEPDQGAARAAIEKMSESIQVIQTEFGEAKAQIERVAHHWNGHGSAA